jgi:FdhE protein
VQRILERGEIESLTHTSFPRLRLPQYGEVFVARAARLADLAQGKVTGIPVNTALSGYLSLMQEVVVAQADMIRTISDADPGMPPPESLDLSQQHGMPPLSSSGSRSPAWRGILTKLLNKLDNAATLNKELAAVIASLRALNAHQLEELADAVIEQRQKGLNQAQAPFVAAALQVVWTYQASQLLQQQVPVLGTSILCPVCGSHPVASVIRIGGQSQGYSYLVCGLCASEWHMVRVKCPCCEQNGKIAYQGLDIADGTDTPVKTTAVNVNRANDPRKFARAETCDDCLCYTKIFNQEHDYNVEPLADDLASLTLDILVSEAGYARGSVNPLLWFGDIT